jgi:hypothetical protein
MNTKEEILKELFKVNAEIIMSDYNDGWFKQYMEERKLILEKILKELESDDNDSILNT